MLIFPLLLLIPFLTSVTATGFLNRAAHLQRRACPSGQYQDGQNGCKTCEAGYYCVNSVRNDCPRGQYQPNTGQSMCIQCSPGTYNDQTRATTCKTAQGGYYATGPGATAQTPCGKGNYSAAGASSCTPCPPGYYCNADTTTTPTACQPGRYQDVAGAKESCKDCPRGTFQSGYAATSCCQCCTGYYNDQVSQPQCFKCPNIGGNQQQGTSDPGATSKDSCRAGYNPPISSSCSISNNQCPATSPPVSSNSYSRRDIRQQQLIRRCSDIGGQLCNVLGGGKECIDTQNDLEMCGGCVEPATVDGAGGRDCSAIPGVGKVQCSKGKCIVDSCRKGYEISQDRTTCMKL